MSYLLKTSLVKDTRSHRARDDASGQEIAGFKSGQEESHVNSRGCIHVNLLGASSHTKYMLQVDPR